MQDSTHAEAVFREMLHLVIDNQADVRGMAENQLLDQFSIDVKVEKADSQDCYYITIRLPNGMTRRVRICL